VLKSLATLLRVFIKHLQGPALEPFLERFPAGDAGLDLCRLGEERPLPRARRARFVRDALEDGEVLAEAEVHGRDVGLARVRVEMGNFADVGVCCAS